MHQADILLGKLQQVRQFEPDNIAAFCTIGRELVQLGYAQESRKCYRAAVDMLRRAARAGNVDRALRCEYLIYEAFVKAVEDGQHYYRCFSDWKDELAAMGRRFRDPSMLASNVTNGGGVGLILINGNVLGHSEVLLKLLEARPRTDSNHREPRIYVLDEFEPRFLERCRAIGMEVVFVLKEMAPSPSAAMAARFTWLRERLARDRVRACVWVGAPTMVAFAFSMRIAPVQILWALRFHPVTGPYIDGYITYGARHERERIIGKQAWRVCPVPLAIDATPPDAGAVAELRRRLPQGFLMGTLARPEKIDSKPFLNSVVRILEANPQARYLWTGKEEHAGIAGFFRSAGVADRCHFVGWVDTRLYAAALDLFLESYPFGTGIVPYQALGAGVPLLSYFSEMTIFGVNFWHEYPDGKPGSLERHPILCARTPDEYVQLANKLIADPAFRSEVASRGKRFFEEEINSLPYYSRRFFDTIAEIAANIPAQRKQTS